MGKPKLQAVDARGKTLNDPTDTEVHDLFSGLNAAPGRRTPGQRPWVQPSADAPTGNQLIRGDWLGLQERGVLAFEDLGRPCLPGHGEGR
jgi:hypothetical protein